MGFSGRFLNALSFHGANWTSLADRQRVPIGVNALMRHIPWPRSLPTGVMPNTGVWLGLDLLCAKSFPQLGLVLPGERGLQDGGVVLFYVAQPLLKVGFVDQQE